MNNLQKENEQLHKKLQDLQRKLEATEVAFADMERRLHGENDKLKKEIQALIEKQSTQADEQKGQLELMEQMAEGLKLKIEELEIENLHLQEELQQAKDTAQNEAKQWEEERASLMFKIQQLESANSSKEEECD